MGRRAYGVLTCLVLACACRRDRASPEVRPDAAPPAVVSAKPVEDAAPPDAAIADAATALVPSRAYRGTIGSLPVFVRLRGETGPLTGRYLYESRDTYLELVGQADDAGAFTLEERDPGGKVTGRIVGKRGASGELVGTWTRPNGKGPLPLRVKPWARKPDDPLRLVETSYARSVPAKEGTNAEGERACTYSFKGSRVIGHDDEAAENRINEAIREAESSGQWMPGDPSRKSCARAMGSELETTIDFNELGVFCLVVATSSYEHDTPHPNYAKSIVLVDANDGSPIKLDLKAGAGDKIAARWRAAFPRIEESDFQNGLCREAVNIEAPLLVDRNGIRFDTMNSDPYVIRGACSFELPWADVAPLLEPKSLLHGVAKRMKAR